jgi:hypothetical protein
MREGAVPKFLREHEPEDIFLAEPHQQKSRPQRIAGG